jgi:hypothetical protein
LDENMPTFEGRKLKKLRVAMTTAEDRLRPFRQQRFKMVTELAGSQYAGDRRETPVPINLIEMASEIYLAYLAAKAPRVLMTTEYPWLKAMALTRELAVNKLIEEIHFEKQVRHAVRDALLCVGALAIGKQRKATTLGQDAHTGTIWAQAVDLDDLTFDMAATAWEAVSFYGYRVRVPLEWAQENPGYIKAAREKLKSTPKKQYNADGTPGIESLSQQESGDIDEYLDHVELYQIWLPFESKNGLVLTINSDENPLVLCEEEYEGPPEGAMHLLGFSEMPKSIMPNCPVNHWYDLHDCANNLLNKVREGAESQKDVLAYQGEAVKDAERVLNAKNLECLRLDHPEAFKMMKFGGADAATLATFGQVNELFNMVGGNLYSLGGLSATANTLGAEELIGQNASKRVQQMSYTTYQWVRDCCKALDWFAWHDPLYDPVLYKEVGNLKVRASYAKEHRIGDPRDCQISIQPYSMQYRSPEQEYAVLVNFWGQFIAPMMQTGALEQAGATVDIQALLKTAARLQHFPFLEDLVKFGKAGVSAPGPMGQNAPQGEDQQEVPGNQASDRRGRMPANTTRNYVRHPSPGPTMQGQQRNNQQMLLQMASRQQKEAV